MKKNVLIFFILSLISYKINGQILLSDSLVKNKSFQFAKFKGTSNTLATADNINSIITKFSGQQKDITSKEVFIEKDAFGKIHIKHQLFFRGIVIRGGEYVIHSDPTGIDFVNGFMAPIDISIADFKNTKRAEEIAVNNFFTTHSKNKYPLNIIVKKIIPIYYYNYTTEQFEPTFQVSIETASMQFAENIY